MKTGIKTVKERIMEAVRERVEMERRVCVSYLRMLAAKEKNSQVSKKLESVADDIEEEKHKKKSSLSVDN